MSHISLEHVDHTGALREMADGVGAIDGDGTRRDLLRKAGMTGAGFVAGGVLFNGLLSPAEAAGISWKRKRSNGNDVKIAQLRADARVPRGRVLQGGGRQRRRQRPRRGHARPRRSPQHEAAHVKALKQALGRPR